MKLMWSLDFIERGLGKQAPHQELVITAASFHYHHYQTNLAVDKGAKQARRKWSSSCGAALRQPPRGDLGRCAAACCLCADSTLHVQVFDEAGERDGANRAEERDRHPGHDHWCGPLRSTPGPIRDAADPVHCPRRRGYRHEHAPQVRQADPQGQESPHARLAQRAWQPHPLLHPAGQPEPGYATCRHRQAQAEAHQADTRRRGARCAHGLRRLHAWRVPEQQQQPPWARGMFNAEIRPEVAGRWVSVLPVGRERALASVVRMRRTDRS
jgi:hypothetical protein